jgi:chloramphenicol O-acetyltransferase
MHYRKELSELSLDLQNSYTDLYKESRQKIKTLVKVFEERRKNPGPYYDKSLAAAKCLTFQGIQLHKKDRKDDPRFVLMRSMKT